MPVPPVRDLRALVLDELRQERAYLLPLRLFLGVGWIRAGVEKALDTGWYDGSELTSFLTAQLAGSQATFPLYGAVMEGVLLPLATPVGIVVLLVQLLIGTAIVVGYRTGPALVIGILLNLNFVLAGVPDPSTFYIVIQLVLFAGGAGRVLGVDGAQLSRRDAARLLGAPAPVSPARRRVYGALAIACVAFAAAVSPSVRSLDPATVVEDPAMILVVLGLFAAGIAGLGALRTTPATAVVATTPVPPRLTAGGAPLR